MLLLRRARAGRLGRGSVRLVFFLVVAAALVRLATRAPGRVVEPPDRGRKNILLITVECLRADHLHGDGSARPATPELDSLARRGTRFSCSISAANWTLGS